MRKRCKHTIIYRQYESVGIDIQNLHARIHAGDDISLKTIDKKWSDLTPEEMEEVDERSQYICGNDCPERKKE